MKFYVAGIRISDNHIYDTSEDNTTRIINLLQPIHDDAVEALGDDVTVVVILEEYALTQSAITAEKRKNIVARLQQATALYNNMILIPGTLASYKEVPNQSYHQKTFAKLISNCHRLNEKKIFPETETNNNLLDINLQSRADNPELLFLSNTAYILTAMGKTHHKKAAPIREKSKIPFAFRPSVYCIGSSDFIKSIDVSGETIDTAIFICREHAVAKPESITNNVNPPLLHVIVSASIDVEEDKLLGALNLHMDNCSGLSVRRNLKHYRAAEVGDVVASTYITSSLAKYEIITVAPMAKKIKPTYLTTAQVEMTPAKQTSALRQKRDRQDELLQPHENAKVSRPKLN